MCAACVTCSLTYEYCGQFPGNLAERSASSSVVRDFSLLLYSVASLSHLSHTTYELSIVMRSLGITKIPSLVVSTSSNFDSVSKPFVTSLQSNNALEHHHTLLCSSLDSAPMPLVSSWSNKSSLEHQKAYPFVCAGKAQMLDAASRS